MIPPVVLDAKEGMSVLDMCAAPGSKTCQILEAVGGMPAKDGEISGSNVEPKGYIVANDADPKRAYMLVTQLRRLQSPAVFVTSADGQFFPVLDEKNVRGTDKEGMFDRVLCDVPCRYVQLSMSLSGMFNRIRPCCSLQHMMCSTFTTVVMEQFVKILVFGSNGINLELWLCTPYSCQLHSVALASLMSVDTSCILLVP